MLLQYCDECGIRVATIYLTKITGNTSVQRKLCEECAQLNRDAVLEGVDMEAFTAAPEEFVGQLFEQAVQAGLITPEEAEALKDQGALESISFKEVTAEEMAEMLNAAGEEEEDSPAASEDTDDENIFDPAAESHDFDLGELARMTRQTERAGLRCPKCDMTWDRLKEDGRAGCAQCYATFDEELREVMQKMQRSMENVGKQPRTAEKRKRRLEHLRQRRDSQLELLQRRLDESLAAERYEEAAKLRDKIKVVNSTIVEEG